MIRARWPVVAALALAVVVMAVLLVLWPRGGLPSRPVSSVPELLSEPAGVPGEGLVLAADGLGPVTFGQAADEVIATLTELLGDPVEDGPQSCPAEGREVRWVRWGNLSITFSDGFFAGHLSGVYFPPDGPELAIETEEGIGLRATTAELMAAYADRVAWLGPEEGGFGEPLERYGIDGFDTANPAPTGLGGLFEGSREAGRVITIMGGQLCGPPRS